MSQPDARLNISKGGEQQPSHEAIDNGNPAIFHPVWFVFDDVFIDAVSVGTTFTTIAAVILFGLPLRYAPLPFLFFLLPLRTFFPRPKVPQGRVLITGASSGIGAELAYIFAERGHELILVGRNEEQLEAVKRNVRTKFNGKAYTISTDLSLPGAAKELYDHVTGKGLDVDVLVNNAGLGGAGDPFEQSIEFTERMTTLNCIALVQLTQLFGRDMIKRNRGWMLQTSSVGGWMASPGQNLYHASKHFVRAFSEALSVELRAYPNIVNTQLMPGPTSTQFITRAQADETFMMAASGSVEDPRSVAMVGYQGLCKGKRMVFSSWNAAFMGLSMQLAPRSVQLIVASLANAPLRGLAKATTPTKHQERRGQDLKQH